jgi:hypothetical protein
MFYQEKSGNPDCEAASAKVSALKKLPSTFCDEATPHFKICKIYEMACN